MSAQVNYQELEQLVDDQSRVHAAAFYQNARPRTQKIYDQTIQMGQDILADRNEDQPSPQIMVDMAVQSINTAIKALKSNPVLNASMSKANTASSAQSQAKVRPSQVGTQSASSRQSSATPTSSATNSNSTQATTVEAQATSDAHSNTNTVADTAPSASPTTTQQAAAPSQPTAPVQPTVAQELTGDQLNAKITVPMSAVPESAAPQEDKDLATLTSSAASKKEENKAEAEKTSTDKRNLPMVVHQKPDWHLLPQAIWRGLQWTLGSKRILKNK